MSVADVEWFARETSATELMEMSDTPSAICEVVGDWVENNCTYDTEDEWSDLCFVFYEWWGCEHIASHTPEWDAFWQQKVTEECDT